MNTIILILYTSLLLHFQLLIPLDIDNTQKQNKDIEMINVFDWELLLDALQFQESRNNPRAFNVKEDAAGILQIRPIYLQDVNRIVGYEKYKLQDRYNIEKSREMVKIFFSYYVKNENINEIIAMHCSGPNGKQKLKTSTQIKNYVKNVLIIQEGLKK